MVLRLTGGKLVMADRDTVWAALHDVACLKLCVPGCLSLDRVSQTRFDVCVLVPLGPVSVAFSGSVETFDCDPLLRLSLKGRGDGGLAGLAAGTAHITLTDAPGGCHLAYVLDVEPSGPFAVLGTLLLAGVARKLVDRFGTTLAAIIGDATRADPALPPLRRNASAT